MSIGHHKRGHIPRPAPPSTGRVEHVRLVECSRAMMHLLDLTGTVEGYAGDELLVRFGEVVIQVPPEYVEPVEK